MATGKTEKLVIYIRVSSEEQSDGWSLQGQEQDARNYAASIGANVLAVYQDIASGWRNVRRPGLDKAIAHAHREKAGIVVYTLDRLGRNSAKLHQIHDSGLPVHVTTKGGELSFMEFSIYAMLAQEESNRISMRTKSGLKTRFAATGLRNGGDGDCKKGNKERKSDRGNKASVKSRKEIAIMGTVDTAKVIKGLLAEGLGYSAIARKLEAYGVETVRGGKWSAARVKQLVLLHGLPLPATTTTKKEGK